MKLDMVGIIVSDMGKAKEFYERLGFQVLGKFDENYMELKNQGVRISLNSKSMIEGVYGCITEMRGERIELAFLCDSSEEVDHTCNKMASYGYEIFKQPWNAFWGQRYALIKDTDQNLLALFANEIKE